MNITDVKPRRAFRWLLYGAIIACAVPSSGAEPKKNQQKNDPVEIEQVEFYAAIRDGKIDVGVVPSSYSSLAMRVRNISRSPLKIELPKVFAAVPVARMQAKQAMQMRGVQASLSSNFGQNYGNSQGLGGSLGGPWWGNSLAQKSRTQNGEQENQDGPQFLTLAPGRFAQTKIPCFCLEFGKPDPNSRIPYVICPLEDLNSKAAVAELLERFAKQGVNQYVAQLAAWHIANDIPWQMLTTVQFPRTKNSRGHRVTKMELVAAKKLAESMPSYGRQASLGGAR